MWWTEAELWGRSLLAFDIRTYALIDPPESGLYRDVADCHVIKWASNNEEKHYKNWEKDGHLLVTAMPTLEEVAVMVPILWTDATPFPGQKFATLEAKVEEIKKRCSVCSPMLRPVFNYKLFAIHMDRIVLEANTSGMTMPIEMLKDYFKGKQTNSVGHPSSVSSVMFALNWLQGDPTHNTMFATLNPLASVALRKRLEMTVAGFDGKTAYQFEDFAATLLQGGHKHTGGPDWPPRARVDAASNQKRSAANVLMLAKDQTTLAGDQQKLALAQKELGNAQRKLANDLADAQMRLSDCKWKLADAQKDRAEIQTQEAADYMKQANVLVKVKGDIAPDQEILSNRQQKLACDQEALANDQKQLTDGLANDLTKHARDQATLAVTQQKLAKEQVRYVVGSTNFPFGDCFTSPYDVINVKAGPSKPSISAGGFVKYLQLLNLAHIVADSGDLKWFEVEGESKESDITLILLRNCAVSSEPGYTFKDTLRKGTPPFNFVKVSKFFEKHVNVKQVDLSNWSTLSVAERATITAVERNYEDYKKIIEEMHK